MGADNTETEALKARYRVEAPQLPDEERRSLGRELLLEAGLTSDMLAKLGAHGPNFFVLDWVEGYYPGEEINAAAELFIAEFPQYCAE